MPRIATTHAKPRLDGWISFVCLAAACLAVGALFDMSGVKAIPATGTTVFVATLAALAALAAIAVALVVRRRMTPDKLVMLLFAAGFVLRAAYALYTPVMARQHDVGGFNHEQPGGHAGYIVYLFENLRLPDGDPRDVWQFYHPPLHHMLSALWLRAQALIGVGYARSVENIKLLTLFYSSACMLVGYGCFRELGLRKVGLVAACALIAFHPSFILRAGSVNNDTLSICLSFAAIWAALRWYKRPTVRRVLAVALCVGFGMMAKLSAALVAPAIAALFLWKLVENRADWRAYIRQFAAFAVVCVPLGLGWQIYANARFGMPISYVPLLPESNGLYIGDRPLWDRLFDFRLSQLDPVYLAWRPTGASYLEYNMFVALLKTALFDEYRLFPPGDGNVARLGGMLCRALTYAQLALVACALVAAIGALCTRRGLAPPVMRLAFALVTLVTLGSYIDFCIRFPHTCTMNMRYAMPLILAAAALIGRFLCRDDGNAAKPASRLVNGVFVAVVAVFCALSAGVYTLLALAL